LVLTGDKIGTAINIGMSAGLLDDSDKMTQYIIKEATDHESLSNELSHIMGEMERAELNYKNK